MISPHLSRVKRINVWINLAESCLAGGAGQWVAQCNWSLRFLEEEGRWAEAKLWKALEAVFSPALSTGESAKVWKQGRLMSLLVFLHSLLCVLCALWAGKKAGRRQEDRFGWETMKAWMKVVAERWKRGGDFQRSHNKCVVCSSGQWAESLLSKMPVFQRQGVCLLCTPDTAHPYVAN